MGRLRDAWNALTGATPQPRSSHRVFAADPYADEKGDNMRKVGAGGRDKSLDGPAHEKMVTDSVRAFQADGIARQWVKLKTGFVIGNCPRATAEIEDEALNAEVQQALDEFQDDPVTALPARMAKYVRNLYATGGLCLLVAEGDGAATHTRLGRVDQEDIERAYTDPDNADLRIGIIRRGRGFAQGQVVHPVIGPDREVHELFRGLAPGETVTLPGDGQVVQQLRLVVGQKCMYLALNDLSGQHLGISDLFPALDDLRDLDDLSTSGTHRAIAAQGYAHARKVPKGTSQTDIDKLAEAIEGSVSKASAAVLVYTDDQSHEILSPTLNAADLESALGVPFKRICITSGLPPHWLAEPGEVNLATAGEMAGPVIAMLEEDQSAIRGFFEALILYALLRKPRMRGLWEADPANVSFTLNLPALTSKDAVRESTIFTSDLAALATMRSDGAITMEAYQRMVQALAASYRPEFTYTDEDIPDPDEVEAQRAQMLSALQGLRPGGEDDVEVDEDGQEGDERRAA